MGCHVCLRADSKPEDLENHLIKYNCKQCGIYQDKLHFDVKHYNFLKWSENDREKGKKELEARITATFGYGPHRTINEPLRKVI